VREKTGLLRSEPLSDAPDPSKLRFASENIRNSVAGNRAARRVQYLVRVATSCFRSGLFTAEHEEIAEKSIFGKGLCKFEAVHLRNDLAERSFCVPRTTLGKSVVPQKWRQGCQIADLMHC
jgi:hypothetical protein